MRSMQGGTVYLPLCNSDMDLWVKMNRYDRMRDWVWKWLGLFRVFLDFKLGLFVEDVAPSISPLVFRNYPEPRFSYPQNICSVHQLMDHQFCPQWICLRYSSRSIMLPRFPEKVSLSGETGLREPSACVGHLAYFWHDWSWCGIPFTFSWLPCDAVQ